MEVLNWLLYSLFEVVHLQIYSLKLFSRNPPCYFSPVNDVKISIGTPQPQNHAKVIDGLYITVPSAKIMLQKISAIYFIDLSVFWALS